MLKYKYNRLDFKCRGGVAGGTDEIIDPWGNYHLLRGYDKIFNKWRIEVFNPDTKLHDIYYTK